MKLCSHLTYRKSLSPGKAVFYYQTDEADFVPLQLEREKIRGTKAGYAEAYDKDNQPLHLQPQDLAFGNPHTIDKCYVPPTVDEVFCRFSLRVEASSVAPFVCANSNVTRILSKLSASYRLADGYQELAKRYSKNLLMGQWLWANRENLDVEITITTSNNNEFVVKHANHLDWDASWGELDSKTLDSLTAEMKLALEDPRRYWFADVTAKIATSFCAPIHPSQLFTDKEDKDISSRQYAEIKMPDGQHAVCLTADKIGAAIQLIDDWWDDKAHRRLRVNEFGADIKDLVARRHTLKGKDFYSMIKRAAVYERQLRHAKGLPNAIDPDVHFLMSVLCKGGMFQGHKEPAKPKDKPKKAGG